MVSDEKSTKLMEQTDRGQKAEATLKELEGAFEALIVDCFDTFKNSAIHDDEGRKTCRLYLKVLEDVKDRFETAVVNGKAARQELVRLGDEKRK